MRMRGILNCQDMMLNQYNVISSMGMRSVLDSQDMVLYQDYVVSRMRVRGVLNDERDPCRRRRCAKIDSEHSLPTGWWGWRRRNQPILLRRSGQSLIPKLRLRSSR